MLHIFRLRVSRFFNQRVFEDVSILGKQEVDNVIY